MKILAVVLVFSYFFEKLSIDMGFYLQLYMVLSFIVILSVYRVFKFKRLLPYEWFLVCFYIYYASGTILTTDKIQAIRMFFGINIFLVCYFIGRFIFYKAGVEIIEKALLYTGGVFLIISLVLYLMGLQNFVGGGVSGEKEISYGLMNDRGMPRMLGVAFNPDYFFMFLAPFLFLYLDKSIKSEWYYVPFIMAIVCVVLTLSISAYAATCVGFITYFALKKRLRLMFILVLLMASSVAILFANFPMMGNILEIRSANLESGSGRYDLWRYALSLFEEHPIFGIGTNGLKFYTASRFDIVNVHSTFIEILVESGIVGSIIYLLFIIMLIVELIKKRNTIRRLPFLAATLVSLFIVMFSVSATIQQAYLFILLLSYTYLSATSIISSNMTTQFKRYCG